MDPIASINPRGDSTFALMLEAQARGHMSTTTRPTRWRCATTVVTASVAPLDGDRRQAQGRALHARRLRRVDLGTYDVVLMRQDPPFDMNYVTLTHLLERIHPKTFVVNPPAAVRNAPRKSSSPSSRT